MSKSTDPRAGQYLARNKAWAASPMYVPPIKFKDMQKKGREREDGTVIVLACTDPRVTPEDFLGMDSSNKATVVRTAGGRVTPAMSTLLVLSAVGNGGKKGLIMIVHHTDCGLCYATDAEIAESLKGCVDSNAEKAMLDGMKFGSIGNPEATVREDVELLRATPFFKGTQILGFVQDTETGIVREVVGV